MSDHVGDLIERVVELSDRVSELLSQKADLTSRIRELETEIGQLSKEWTQECIDWRRDKHIDRLMSFEDENKRLTAENAQLRKALAGIEEGTILQFEENEKREVEVWMDTEDMQEIARQALSTVSLKAQP